MLWTKHKQNEDKTHKKHTQKARLFKWTTNIECFFFLELQFGYARFKSTNEIDDSNRVSALLNLPE